MRRVAITGLGVICALGKTTKDFWASLQQGTVGIAPITAVDRSCLRFQNGAEIPDYNPVEYFQPKQADLMDRFAQFAVIAAKEAVKDAGLDLTPELRSSAAVITGACVGGQTSEDQGFYDIYHANRNRVHPMTIPKTMANAGASHICMELGITGAAFTISTACSSAAHAVGLGYSMVASGMAPVALVGGSEAPFSLGLLKAWEALRVVSAGTCRPFSKDRSGMILGEGGAMLVLEPLDSARARGVHIYGEVAGFGMSSDACHITHPSSDGAAAAIQRALSSAGVAPEQIGYINAHGTGTEVNDSTETAAIRKIFGAHADKLAVSSTKSMHGHTLGAAGALEAAAAVLAMHYGVLPPTANYTTPDPACDLDVVPNQARKAEVECVLSNSFAFGGLNAALVFKHA